MFYPFQCLLGPGNCTCMDPRRINACRSQGMHNLIQDSSHTVISTPPDVPRLFRATLTQSHIDPSHFTSLPTRFLLLLSYCVWLPVFIYQASSSNVSPFSSLLAHPPIHDTKRVHIVYPTLAQLYACHYDLQRLLWYLGYSKISDGRGYQSGIQGIS